VDNAVTIGTEALQIFKSGPVCLAHMLNVNCIVVNFDARLPVRAAVDLDRVETTSLATQ
jgi:hypothetical protein